MAGKLNLKFDAKQLRLLVTEASRTAFTQLRDVHREDPFYAFNLCVAPELSWVGPSASSEHGLVVAAAEHVRMMTACHLEIDGDPTDEVRWSTADSPYHLVGEEHFSQVNHLLGEIARDLSGATDHERNVYLEMVESTLFSALQSLDQEGFFGSGQARHRVVVNIRYRDQSSRCVVENAKRLNPPAALTRLIADFPVTQPRGNLAFLGGDPIRGMYGLAYASDSRIIAAAGAAYAGAWSIDDGATLVRYDIPAGTSAWSAAFTPDAELLIVAEKRSLRLFAVTRAEEHAEIPWFNGDITSVAVSPDGQSMAVGDWSPQLTLLQVGGHGHGVRSGSGQTFDTRWTNRALARHLSFSPEGRVLAAAGHGVTLFDVSTGALLAELEIGNIGPQPGSAAAWSADGQFLATTTNGDPFLLRVWNEDRKKVLEIALPMDRARSRLPTGGPSAVAFSPSGLRIATAHSDGEIHIWRVATGQLETSVRGRWYSLHEVVFIDEDHVAAIGSDVDWSPPIGVWTLT